MLYIILIILLILMLIGGLPHWGYASNYGPSGIIGVVLIVLVVYLLVGRV